MTPISVRAHRAVGSCIVEASAGTGKTRELVNRIVAAVVEGCGIEHVVAVTFTHAAAGEMKLRLRQELDRARDNPRAGEALQHLERAFIGTIHSFCAQMLRERPVEARVDPAFQEMAQPEAYGLFSQVFQRWIQQKLSATPALFHRLFARLSWRDDDPMDMLKNAAWQLAEWRDFPAPWARETFAWKQRVDELLRQIGALLEMRAQCDHPFRDELYKYLQPVQDCWDRFRTAQQLGAADYDAWESNIIRLPGELRWFKKGYGTFSRKVSREAVIAAWEQLAAAIQAFREQADADLAASLRDELWPVVAKYEAAKERTGKLDFTDLLICARNLLRNDDARSYFQRRYQRLFVDEFQDTDPLQADILDMLAGENIFIVGDPKQSIYRFRRADVELYRRFRKDILAAGASSATLNASRRSIVPLQDFVNAAFDAMPDYIPLTQGREPYPGQPAVIALPLPHPYGLTKITKTAIDKCGPATVAAFIEWLLARKWRVSDREDPARTREMTANDICILFRRFTNYGVDLTAEYVRALEDRAIPHVLVGSKSFHSREEVVAIRTALRAVEWPDDELSVFAAIRGGLFSIQDGTLLKFRQQYGTLHPFKELPENIDGEFEPVKDALEHLARLHRARNYRPIADTINRLLEHCRAHAGFAARKGGERVLANVLRLTDLARQFESTSATSFRSFVEYLDEQETARESSDPTVLEQEGEGVRLMTVHRAKGLEFPVVILADLTCKLTSGQADRFTDSQRGICAQTLLGLRPWELLDPQNLAAEQRMNQEEGERVAYVAATRARDLLVVSAIGERDRKLLDETWLSPLHDALYPGEKRFKLPDKPDGCSFRGNTTVLSRPLEHGGQDNSVKPGLHSPCRGNHTILWFDPAELDLSERRSMGLRFEDVLSGSPEEGLRVYEGWRTRQKELIEQASRPLVKIERATEVSTDGTHVEVIAVEKHGRRPAGRTFGKLVHALLQQAELPAQEEDLLSIAKVEARILGSPETDLQPAVLTAMAALRHSLLAGIASAKRFHREFPVVLREQGTLIEGVIDLAFLGEDGWTIVDFKTGPADKKRNRGQLELYRRALQQATSLPVRAVLFEI